MRKQIAGTGAAHLKVLRVRPCSDLVPRPGQGVQALKWTLYTHASARN